MPPQDLFFGPKLRLNFKGTLTTFFQSVLFSPRFAKTTKASFSKFFVGDFFVYRVFFLSDPKVASSLPSPPPGGSVPSLPFVDLG